MHHLTFQRSPRWKSPEREREREREQREQRERLIEEQEHERRREAATKLMINVGGNPYLRDGQNIPRDR